MSSSEDSSGKKILPISPREMSAQTNEVKESSTEKGPRSSRPPETALRMNVQYLHRGESVRPYNPGKKQGDLRKRNSHRKQADRMGILFLVFAVILVILIVLGLNQNILRYQRPATSEKTEKTEKPISRIEPPINEGNLVFDKVFAEEKAIKNAPQSPASSPKKGTLKDLDISNDEQLKIMDQKIKEIRILTSIEQTTNDQSSISTNSSKPLKSSPVNPDNFNSPVEFNTMLSKPLQGNMRQ